MNSPKLTPGPWRLIKRNGLDWRIEGKGGHVCSLDVDEFSWKDAEQDARLIAAAPEMLEALKCAEAALTQPKTFPADIALALKAIQAAIAKAGGAL